LLGDVQELPDGSPIGPNISKTLVSLVSGIRILLAAGFDVHLDVLETGLESDPFRAELDIRFDASIEYDDVWKQVKNAFNSEATDLRELEAVPPLKEDSSKALGSIFEELEIPHTSEASSPAEAGLFVCADIPALLWGPGKPIGPDHVSMTGQALELYAESVQELFERLLIRG
jgi:hypothetical protein